MDELIAAYEAQLAAIREVLKQNARTQVMGKSALGTMEDLIRGLNKRLDMAKEVQKRI